MGLKRGLKNIFNSVAGNIPVIGPHAGIEADLMLAGKKPLTWISVDPDDAVFADTIMQAEHEGRKKLDEAVRQGKLKSMDVIQHRMRVDPYDLNRGFMETPTPSIFRHYCQPDKEKDMRTVAAFNQQVFNGQEPTVELEKDMGEYLGYRTKDIKLWQTGGIYRQILNSATHLPPRLREKTFHAMDKVFNSVQAHAQPAYQQKMLHQIKKDEKKALKQERKQNKNQPKL